MEESRQDRILNRICRILVIERGEKALSSCFKLLAEEIGCDGGLALVANDIPFLLEIRGLWSAGKDKLTGDEVVDFSENQDKLIDNPFSINTGQRTLVCNDITKIEINSTIKEVVEYGGVSSFMLCTLKRGSEFLGDAVLFDVDPHEWTAEEFDLFAKACELIATEVEALSLRESYERLIGETDKNLSNLGDATNRFISNLSHEIRTPMNAVVGMLAIMRHNIDNRDVLCDCFERLDKSSKQLMDTVNNCIDMTLLNNDAMLVNNEWVQTDTLLNSVKHNIDALIEGRSQNLYFEFDPGVSLFTDRVRLERILTNAISYSSSNSESGTDIRLLTHFGDEADKSMVIFRIQDERKGISEEAAKHIFEIGAIRENSLNAKNSLGMTVAKHMVDLLHGSIEYFSDGNGTELIIQLPIKTKGAKKAEANADSSDTVVGGAAEMYIGRRILIAEDNVLMGEILATILGYRGLETDMALDGREAVEKFTSNSPFYYDMILMDIRMPVMDGLEATKEIRASGRPDAGLVPIAALSANAFEEDVKEAIEAGMNTYLCKPVDEKELFSAISNLVL